MGKYQTIKILSFILGLIVLAFFIYSLINYKVLQNELEGALGEKVEQYGLPSVFVLGFLLEISPQPFASALVPFANGVLIGLDFTKLLIFMLVGVVLASFFAYWLGIYCGKAIAVKLVGLAKYDGAHKTFKKYGRLGMAILALTPLPYFPILGGIFKMKFIDFVLYAVFPRMIHMVVYGYLIAWVL
jgi:membrane protein YqaA with SNARE-associated domain